MNIGQKQSTLINFIAGGIMPLALAPFHYWPVALLSLTIFAFSFQTKNTNRQVFSNSFCFGLGLFASGVSWVYVSIHDYGYAPVPLALLLTAVFVIGLALVFSLPFILYQRFLNHSHYPHNHLSTLLAFPAIWVLGEWLRSWLLTGFPWLYIGYSQVEAPLSGWFPLIGVFGVSYLLAFSSVLLAFAIQQKNTLKKALSYIIAISLFLFSLPLKQIHWSDKAQSKPISVAIIQPNFSLQEKWNPANKDYIRKTLLDLSQPHLGKKIILWPEAALPELQHKAGDFLKQAHHSAQKNGSTLVLGIPSLNRQGQYQNSIIALGSGSGNYHKVKLVPFGEYVPLEKWLRGLIHFFDLPMSHFSKGEEQQSYLQADSLHFSTFICYEIVYPDFVAKRAGDADFMVTISNDSWFGQSIGPLQHLQMAQARALENGRYLLRGTNNGVSAIINPTGKIIVESKQFEQHSITGYIYPMIGKTPFSQLGSLPTLFLLFASLVFLQIKKRYHSKPSKNIS